MSTVPAKNTTTSGLIDTRAVADYDTVQKKYTPRPNVDYMYGPYSSLEEAWTKLSDTTNNSRGLSALVIGKTVGIIQSDGSIKEYWFEKACASVSDLVAKNSGGGTTLTQGAGINPTSFAGNSIAVDFADDSFVDDLITELGEEESTPTASEDGTLHYVYPYDGSSLENPSGVLLVNLVKIDNTNKKATVQIYNTAAGTITSGDIVGTIVKQTDGAGETATSIALTSTGEGGVTAEISYTGDISSLQLLLQVNTSYQYTVIATAQKYISLTTPSNS